MKRALSFLLMISLSEPVLSESEGKVKTQTTQQLMNVFLENMIGLKKYMGSDKEFTDPQNTQKIQSHLKELAAKVKEAGHDPVLTMENFKFSRQVLEDHIVETERVFRLGNKIYARSMVNATLGICLSCHSQMPTPNKKFDELVSAKIFKSDFDKADFLFSVRDFSQANGLFDKLISTYPESKLTTDQLETSLRRQVGYYSRILRSPQQGAEALSKYLKNSKIEEYQRKNLTGWIQQFQNWQKIKIPDTSKATAAEVLSFAKTHTSIDSIPNNIEGMDPRFVSNMFVSGVLYEYMNKHPHSPETPEILYRLALCDRELSNAFFYSLADLFLRECMIRFPASATAQKCFKEYEENMILGYTGSSGINVPPDVKAELKSLKEFVDKKGKIEIKGQNK